MPLKDTMGDLAGIFDVLRIDPTDGRHRRYHVMRLAVRRAHAIDLARNSLMSFTSTGSCMARLPLAKCAGRRVCVRKAKQARRDMP